MPKVSDEFKNRKTESEEGRKPPDLCEHIEQYLQGYLQIKMINDMRVLKVNKLFPFSWKQSFYNDRNWCWKAKIYNFRPH